MNVRSHPPRLSDNLLIESLSTIYQWAPQQQGAFLSKYSKEDPIDQVYRLIREIKGGHFKDKDGREIKVPSERIPAYAYVICDTTKEMEIIAENKGLWPTPDRLGYFGYNQSLSAYVEVLSYDKLL